MKEQKIMKGFYIAQPTIVGLLLIFAVIQREEVPYPERVIPTLFMLSVVLCASILNSAVGLEKLKE